MDRDAIARAGRRSQAEDALAFERDREAALRLQIAELVLEEEGPRVDAEAFAALVPDDVRRVRAALGETEEVEPDAGEDEDPFAADPEGTFADDPARSGERDGNEDEIARLEREIAESQRSQAALEHFIAALDRPAVPEAH